MQGIQIVDEFQVRRSGYMLGGFLVRSVLGKRKKID